MINYVEVTEPSEKRTPDSEVKVPTKRYRHTESYKQEVVDQLAELRKTGSGEIGGYLRSKGLYASTVIKWEKKMKRGNKLLVTGSKEKVLVEKVKVLEKELERTRKKLVKTEIIVEFQKKISRLLEQEEER